MKAAVFGGSGFLGRHVADTLSAEGYQVLIYDLFPAKGLARKQTMVVGDILDEETVLKAVAGCSVVYNFAGVADILAASLNPVETVRTNVLGNTIILDACRKTSVERFVYASSLYIYSRAGSFYRSAKQACELIIENYGEVYGLAYTIMRYGSLYGPGADSRNFIHKILRQALTEGKITREGDGEELREYIHVLDAARLSVEILSGELFKNEYVVITGSQQMRVRDLLTMINEILGGGIEMEFVPPTNDFHYEITPYSFSPRMAKRIAGRTYFDLGQGILKCLEEIHREITTPSQGGGR